MFQVLTLHRNKIIAVFLGVLLLQVVTYFSVLNLEERQTVKNYTLYAKQIREQVQQSIHEKQQATTAIALVLSSHFVNDTKIESSLLNAKHFDDIIHNVNEFSEYKNLWVQVVLPNGQSLYRSWSNATDHPNKIRPEFDIIKQNGRSMKTVTSGFFDISIKSITPITNQGQLLGFIDLISHFNSIQILFEKRGIETLVVATPQRSALIKYPFGSHKIGKHYVSNLNPNMELLKRITPQEIRLFQSQPFTVWQDYLVVPFPLIAPDNSTHGHLYSFSPIDIVLSQNQTQTPPSQIKQWVIETNIVLSILLLVSLGFYLMRRQTQFFKNVINAENEIVAVTNGHQLFDSNQQLDVYFPEIKQNQHGCICDFFLDRPGFITKIYQNQLWLNYLLEHPNKTHKALIKVNDQEITLQLKAKVFDKQHKLAVVVASDISELEGLNQRLLLLNQTDELTRAGSRRHFNKQLALAVHQSHTANTPLSLIMFDIDFFKKVNDTYGHSFGDWVLKKVSDLSFEVINHQQVFYRIGGEEFAIILENTDLDTAKKVAEELRNTIAQADFSQLGQLTISLGVIQLQASENADNIMRRVDKQLYRAKQNGRNQTCS